MLCFMICKTEVSIPLFQEVHETLDVERNVHSKHLIAIIITFSLKLSLATLSRANSFLSKPSVQIPCII